MDADAFRRHGHALVDWIADYYERVEQFPVLARVKPGEIATALLHEIDYDPKDAKKKNEDKKFWVQGKTGGVSAALRDVALWIHLKEDNSTNGDTIPFKSKHHFRIALAGKRFLPVFATNDEMS